MMMKNRKYLLPIEDYDLESNDHHEKLQSIDLRNNDHLENLDFCIFNNTYPASFPCISSHYPKSIDYDFRILLIDHEDSFVHTLATYFRQTGAHVLMVRAPIQESLFDQVKPDLVVLSPGPGVPSDFNCAGTILAARARNLPIFGVCLGLQALVEAYGGKLDHLAIPMHGKPSEIHVLHTGTLFKGLPKAITVGRYHSIFAHPSYLPDDLLVTAQSEDGIIMALEHRQEPVMAVQFHPESIMMSEKNTGMRIIENIVMRFPKMIKQ